MQCIANIPALCSLFNITQAVISPGSRNAPLIFSFTNYEQIACFSIIDERSAAYFALGLAQKSKRPVALVSTSGTAALNYAPALAEAYYQGIPLVAFTADRPKELIDQNDGQTIRQQNIFENYVKASFELPPSESNNSNTIVSDRIIYEALSNAISGRKGPVHINVPLIEPLYEQLPAPQLSKNFHKPSVTTSILSDESLNDLIQKWEKAQNKMFICGFHSSPDYNENLINLAKRDDVVVIAENIANVQSSEIISNPDSFFSGVSGEKFVPEILITVGNSIVSKKLKNFLKVYQIKEHWHIDETDKQIDTFHALTNTIRTNTNWFLSQLIKTPIKHSIYRSLFCEAKAKIDKAIEQSIGHFQFSDLLVFNQVLNKIPENSYLQIANSTPIRYSQLFPSRKDLLFYCNRGTSGIDGCTSTAIGFAQNTNKTVTFISGDIAFMYDSNALWNNYLGKNLKIIVINNGGGTIFNLIQSSKAYNNAKEFFTTPHKANIKHIAYAHGIEYKSASNPDQLSEALTGMYNTDSTCIVEVFTDETINTNTYKSFFETIKKIYNDERVENN